MRKSLLFLAVLFMSYFAYSQTVVLNEGFEGTTVSLTSSSVKNNNNWAVTSQYAATGSKADSAKVGLADTTYLTTPAFSTLGNSSVLLEFSQICKIEFFDAGVIEVSNNNGSTWTQVTTGYLGSGQFTNIGNKFNSTSYADWVPGNNNAVPAASWWKSEIFDISTYAGNASQVKVRFVLMDLNGSGNAGNYGWLIDNVKITKALSELQPPTITYATPMLQDSVYNYGPFTIQATIADASGIDTAMLIYKRTGQAWDTVGMSGAGTTYIGTIDTIPAFALGDTVNYYIVATDASASHNTARNPGSGDVQFVIYTSAPPPNCGTPITTFPIVDNFDANSNVSSPSCGGTYTVTGWTNDGPTNDWAPHSGGTTSSSTGPSGDHTTGSGKYLYTETSCSSGTYEAILTSPCMDLTGLSAPQLEFWYHMYGAAMGTLKVQVWYGGQWVDAWTKSGNQGNAWQKAIVNLIPYKSITKIRFYGTRGTSYTSDMAIDDVKIWVPPANDAGIVELNSPTTPALTGTLPLKVSMKNFGSANLTSATINWEVNGVAQTPYSWTGTLPPMVQADSIQIGTYAFTAGAPSIKIWTSAPNGSTDGFNYNDTLYTSFVVCDGYLRGAYTVGSATSDFATIADAVSALNSCGIDSTVIFNIASGTYMGQMSLNAINGASDTSTITFQSATGNASDVEIKYAASSSADNYVLRLSGAQYVTFKDVTIHATGASYGYGVEMKNGAKYNKIDGCIITSDLVSSSYSRPVVIYGGAKNEFNTINNCTITGGYYAVYCYSGSSTNWYKGNVLTNNDISGFYIYGMYVYGQDSVQVIGNHIHGLSYTYGYGIYNYYNYNGFNFSNNVIQLSPQNYAYGMMNYYSNRNNATTAAGYVTNNMISINSGSGSNYGMRVYYAARINITNNTIHLSAGGTYSRALYQYGNSTISNQNFKNNIFSSYGSGGYAAYFGYLSSITYSDYNDYYSDGSYLAYAGGNITDLASLQTATSMDANSVSVNPQFISSSDLHANGMGIYQKGSADSIVITDIDGDLRDSIPCIGADEFVLLGDDAGISALVSPIVACPGDTSNIIVTVKNYGTDTLYTATVNWAINNALQTPGSFSDTLLPGQSSNFNIGTYIFAANTSYDLVFWTTNPNGIADLQTSNDSLVHNGFSTAFPAGTYLIGSSSSADFSNIDTVMTILSGAGICGPVVFNLEDGTYSGRIKLNNISGASATNTITFKSLNGDSSLVIVNYAATSSQPAAITLSDMSYVTIKGMTINVNGNNTGRGVALWGNSTHNTFSNMVFNLDQTTSSSVSGFYLNAASLKYNTFANNVVNNGYYGAYIRGTSTTTLAKGNALIGNHFNGFYYYGVYAYYQDSLMIKNNTIINGSNANYPRAIYAYYCDGAEEITGNNIQLTPNYYGYGLYMYYNDGTYAERGLIANNMISIDAGTSSSSSYGMYIYNNSFREIYYNSINVISNGSSSRAYYMSSGNNFNIKNNIFSSNAYAYYVSTTSAVLSSDYNVYNTSGNNLAYWSGYKANLAALKSANNMDTHSIEADPTFISSTNLHMVSSVVDAAATPIASVPYDIDMEMRDTLTPDIGADEFTPPAQDITVFDVTAPINGCGLTYENVMVKVRNTGTDTIQGNLVLKYSLDNGTNVVTESVTANIAPTDTLEYTFTTQANLTTTVDSTFNIMVWGVLPQDPLAFNDTAWANPFNGVIPAAPTASTVSSVYATTATLTATSTGIILWYDSLTSTTPLGTGTNYTTPILFDTTNFYCGALATNGCISAYTPVTVNVTGIPAGDVGISAINVNSGCGLDSMETVSIDIYNQGTQTVTTGLTASYQAVGGSWVTPETVTTAIPVGATITYTFTATTNMVVPADSMFEFNAAVTLTGDPYHVNDSMFVDSILSLYTPPAPTATSPINIAYGVTATMSAVSTDTLVWYNTDTATVPFTGGSSITVGPLYSTDTFYVAALAGASGSGQIGNGTVQNSTTSYPTPYGQWYTGSKEQYLILASELQAQGIPPGAIQSLAFDVVSPNAATSAGYNHENFTIKMKNSTATALGSTWETGLSQVYTVSSYQTVTGQNTHLFDTPFIWDGSSNLVVEVCFDNYNGGSSYSNNAIVNSTTTPFVSSHTYRSDGGGVCPSTSTTYTNSKRPNMTLVVENTGCASPKVPVVVNVAPPPAVDAGMEAIINPIGSVQSGLATPIQLKLKNYGTNTLTSTTVSYELDGVVKATYNWTGSVLFGDTSAPFTVYTDTFAGGLHNMRFWVTGANGGTQAINVNDTISSNFTACMSGLYTIGDSTRDYQSFNDAITAIQVAGICGHVTFMVDSGLYNEQLDLTTYTGMDSANTVTFMGAPSDSSLVVLTHASTGSANNYVVNFNDADYFRFKNMSIKASGATYGRVITMGGGSEYNIFDHCQIIALPVGSSNSAAIYSSGGADNHNIFSNNLIKNGYYTIYVRGASSSNREKGTIFDHNIIENFYYYGMYTYYMDSLIIKNNIIKDGPNSYNYPRALYLFYSSGEQEVVGNKISLNPAGYGYGIYMYQNSFSPTKSGLIANNFISINGGTSTNYGIYSYYTAYNRFYNNSINVLGGSTSSRALYMYNGNSNDVINNIFNVDGTGYPYYVSTPASVATSDYNNYFTDGNNIAYWSGNKASLTALQTANSQDSHSKNADPSFFAADDLHTSSIDLNNQGISLSEITVDIDGEMRDTLNPDMGADEYTPPQWDAGIIAITAPTSPLTVGSNPVKVTVRNFGADTLHNASIGWSVNGNLQTAYSFVDSLNSGDTTMNVNIGSYSFVSGANTIKVWTSMPNGHNDQLNYNDTSEVTLIGCTGPLAGIYTIGGASADFPDFSSATQALNYCGVNDTVIFNVNNGTYNEQISIGAINGVSDTSIIVFKSVNNDSTLVTLTYAPPGSNNYVLKLDGADYINFKNITIEGTGTNAYALVMGGGANYNSFTGCIIKAPASTSSSSAAIYSSSGKDQNNTFRYNNIMNGYYGVYFRGQSSTSLEYNNLFEYNNITGYYYYGMYMYYQDSLQLKHNFIQHGSSTSYGYGLYLYYSDGGMNVTGNTLKLSPNSYNYGMRIYYCDATANNPAHINNNFISISNGTSTNRGMYVYNSKYQRIAFNSIHISSGGSTSYGIYVSSGNNNTFMNNNVVNTANSYSIYVSSSSSILNSDYNNFYSNSASNFAYWSGAVSNLSALQTSSGMDSNSISVNPGFYAADDLHATDPLLGISGTPYDNVTTDIDGDVRNTTNPSIGADEYVSLQFDVAAYSLNQPSISYAAVTTNQTVEVVVRNFGTDTITSMNLGYIYANNTPVTGSWTGSLLPGGTLNYTFTNGFTVVAGNQPLYVYTDLSTDQDNTNDTLMSSFTGMPLMNITYTDNFDGPTSYWAQDGGLWQLGAPAQSTLNGPHSAPKAWMTKLSSNYTSSADANLYSPFFNVSGVTNATLKFYHKRKISTNDGGNVQYSTDGGQTWILLGYMGDPAATNWYDGNIGGNHYFVGNQSSWVLSTYDLSSIISSLSNPIQFRFHFMSNASGEDQGWLIDDFSIELPVIQFDGGVPNILKPDTSSIIGTQVTVKAVVQNYGWDTLKSIPMRYVVNSGTPVAETFVVPGIGILPGDTAHYTFNTTFTAPGTAYNLCVYTAVPGDVYVSNDQSCTNVNVTAAPLDAAVLRIVTPGDTIPLFSAATVKVRIINYGTSPLSSVDVQYQVNSTTPVVETWSGTPLAMGDSVDYTFSTTYNPPIGVHQICAKTLLVGDMDPTNDEVCKPVSTDGLVDQLANGMKLWQNIPNPAVANTFVRYEIPTAGYVHFELVNALGEVIYSESGKKSVGVHDVKFNAAALANGIYYYTLDFEGQRMSKQMIINK